MSDVMTSVEEQFAEVLAAAGFMAPEIVADGKIHRFDGPDEKRGKKSAWYVLYADGVGAGSFGDWRTGSTQSWCVKSVSELTAAERAENSERKREMKAAREAEEARNAEAAREVVAKHWEAAGGVRSDQSYVMKKGIRPRGAKQLRDQLLIPLRDIDGTLHSMQYVQPDGARTFKRGGRVAGCFCTVGDEPKDGRTILICEGWATACSLHQATGETVFAAMSAANLAAVAKAARERYPRAAIIVCADDDYRTEGNPGVSKANEAARTVGGTVAMPSFVKDRPDGATDFNDLHAVRGENAVKAAIDAALAGEPLQSVTIAESVARSIDVDAAQSGTEKEAVVEHLMEPHYAVIEGSLCFVGTKIDKETGEVTYTAPVWLCDEMAVLGSGRDDAGRQYRLLQWRRQGNGELIRLAMPSADIGEREGWAAMRNRGLAVATQPAARHRLAYYLQKEGGAVWHEIVSMAGWQHGAYVLPNGDLIGMPARQIFYNGGTPKESAYTPAGSLETWRDTVGAMARENPLIAAAIACSFAGPLLSLIGVRDGIGLHLHARTSSGKSTAGDCAASVWGRPTDVMHTWDGTSIGLAKTAEYANDGLLYLDEIGSGDARKIGPGIYQMLNGVSRLQGTKDGGVVASRSWRLTMISTGEVGMAQYLAEGGQTPRGGQEIRMMDVPADSGAYRAFDSIHGRKDGDAFSTELTAAARANYGTAGRAFVEWLAVRQSEIKEWVTATQTNMLAALETEHPDASPPAKRATRKWGVLVAAAEMASEAGLTGWTRDEARTWVMSAWVRWLGAFGTADRDDERLLEQVDGILRAHELGRFVLLPIDPAKEPSANNILGYRRYVDGNQVFLVLPSAFKDEVIKGYELRHACRVLHEAGMLDRNDKRGQYTVNAGKPAGMVYRARTRKADDAEGRHDD